MAFGLYSLLEAMLLCLNAVCILHEERFLSKFYSDQRGFGEEAGMKTQLLSLIKSIRTVMRVPLVGLNIMTIALKLVFG
ncbi:immediate early response 3-interacting protein 1 [Lingula anatina]|uniref:Immediate early response 3-interacting protein 1 n=1 Tax=Lingula anatina TaxID=7574 RepID=A0A1S3HWA7_LINAN|nr:immediate early response 3-interacting protein 1 [Lingula anatina]|eukprot:XP_013389344.1 immediate early response 3-interacting protein 1 [Lingula anatina]